MVVGGVCDVVCQADHPIRFRNGTDAVPKKRGPKTDVLEALLKRVDGLEQRLKDQKSADPATAGAAAAVAAEIAALGSTAGDGSQGNPAPVGGASSDEKAPADAATSSRGGDAGESALFSPSPSRLVQQPDVPRKIRQSKRKNPDPKVNLDTSEPNPTGPVPADALLDTYFNRFHGKPYHILDESSVRQRLQVNQVPPYLAHAIYAVAAR
jgi:hypothetical protein